MKNKFALGMLVGMLIVGLLSVLSVGVTPAQAADSPVEEFVPVSELLPVEDNSTQASNIGKYCTMAAGGAGLRADPALGAMPFLYLQIKMAMLITDEIFNDHAKLLYYKLSKDMDGASLVAWARPAQCPLIPGQ